MHDIKAIRDDKDAFIAGLKRRGIADAQTVAEDILDRDHGLRALQTRLQQAQARRNEASKLIGQAKAKKDEAQATALMEEVAGLKEEIQSGEEEERKLKADLDSILASLPNIPVADAPDGADENDNVEVKARAFGTRPTMNAAKEHFDLGEALGLMDFERAAKVSGARFVYLKGGLARLERALGAFMLDLHTTRSAIPKCSRRCWCEDEAALERASFQSSKMINSAGWSSRSDELAQFRARIENIWRMLEMSGIEHANGYSLNDLPIKRRYRKSLWLIPTAEVSLTNYVREEILDEVATADAADGVDAVFPRGSGRCGQGHARDDPAASVLEGGTGLDRDAGAIRCRA